MDGTGAYYAEWRIRLGIGTYPIGCCQYGGFLLPTVRRWGFVSPRGRYRRYVHSIAACAFPVITSEGRSTRGLPRLARGLRSVLATEPCCLDEPHLSREASPGCTYIHAIARSSAGPRYWAPGLDPFDQQQPACTVNRALRWDTKTSGVMEPRHLHHTGGLHHDQTQTLVNNVRGQYN